MKWFFNTYVDGVRDIHYGFDSREKAEQWQKDFIADMKRIGWWPLNGIKTRVEEN